MPDEQRSRPAGTGPAPRSLGDTENGTAHDEPTLAAEAAVLGAMLMSAAARDGVPTMIVVDDFDRAAHRTLYSTLLRMHTAGEVIDHVTVGAELHYRDQLDEIGGTASLHELTDPAAMPAPSSWPAYSTIVAREGRRRRAIVIVEDVLRRLKAGEDPAVVAAWAGGAA